MAVAGAGRISRIDVVCRGSVMRDMLVVPSQTADHSIGIVVDAE